MEKGKSVAYIIPSLETGGAEIQTINHVNHLRQHGIDVVLIVLSNRKHLISELALDTDKLLVIQDNNHTIYNKQALKSLVQKIPRIAEFLKRNQVTTAIAIMPLSHFIGRLTKLYGRFFSGLNIDLFIYHRSAMYAMNPDMKWTAKLLDLFQRKILATWDTGHIFISEYAKKDILPKYGSVNHAVIYNSIPDRKIDLIKARQILENYKIQGKFILIPGRLHPIKGHTLFLEAWADAAKKIPSLELPHVIMAGGGQELENILKITAKHRLDGFIHVTGTIANETMLGLMKLSDLVVIPSLDETLGNVAIEALKCQCRIISSDAGGLPEIIQHEITGYLFQSQNQSALTGLLRKYLTDDLPVLQTTELINAYNSKFRLETQLNRLVDLIHMKKLN